MLHKKGSTNQLFSEQNLECVHWESLTLQEREEDAFFFVRDDILGSHLDSVLAVFKKRTVSSVCKSFGWNNKETLIKLLLKGKVFI